MAGHEIQPTVRVSADDLLAVANGLMVAAGSAPKTARIAAEVFVDADLKGIGLQGVDYLPLMVRAIASGRVSTDQEPVIASEDGSVLMVNGRNGVGQYVAQWAVSQAVPKARQTGVCAVGLIDASEIYMLGYYAEQIARNGLIGLCTTTWAPLVHPWGGREALLGTNPIAFGFPIPNADPVVVDMATSALANGRVRQAAYHDQEVPLGVGLGPDGRPTTVAKEIQKGAISPLGEGKGYALSLAIALLCGPVVGADIGRALAGLKGGGETTAKLGHFFLLIDPEKLAGNSSYGPAAAAFLDELRSSEPAPGFDRVRVPGDRAFEARRKSLEEGVDVLEATWDIIANLCLEFDVPLPGAR